MENIGITTDNPRRYSTGVTVKEGRGVQEGVGRGGIERLT